MSSHHDKPGGGSDRPLDPHKLLRAAAAGGDATGATPGTWQPPPVEQLGEHFPELEIVELIGRGGMGAVYRAVQTRLGRTVALKVLPQELAADPAFEERFQREARALAGLHHPRILTVHDFGERGGFFYFITEFVEGMNLRQLMDMGLLSPAEALRIAPQICEALQYAHDHGVVHRDIKPENLLIDTKGEVVVADFGLARILGEAAGTPALTRSTQVLGTPQYMAPEQWRKGAVDHRADIYAVGVVLYEMLTGQLPIGQFDPPSRRQGVPPGLDAVVQRSLAQQPEQRYQQASEVGDDLRRQGLGSSARGDRSARRASRDTDAQTRAPGIPGVLKAVWLALVVGLLGSLWFTDYMNREYQRHYLAREQFVRNAADAAKGASQPEHDPDDYLTEKLIPDWQARKTLAEERGEAFTEPRPEWPQVPIGEPKSYLWIWFGWLAALGGALFTACGFLAIRSIRHRRQGVAGLGLAVFTAWVLPVAVAVMVPAGVLHSMLRNRDIAAVASVVLGVIVGLGGIVWMVLQHRRVAREVE